ncbi:MAG: serine--tRNA ligase [Bacteroidetes bacterium]|nr:serine--tRNA ligase [Bacteroidota bacterium]HET6244177.1 serine--tRNA ligase [Bacteroidia bacterium]
MLQVSVIRENTKEVIQRLAVKNFQAEAIINSIIDLDNQRKKIQTELDAILSDANNIAREIGELFKLNKAAEANDLKNKSAAIKETSRELQEELNKTEEEIKQQLYLVPNLPHKSVPRGKTPEDNEIVHSEGDIPQMAEDAKPHWDLAKTYDIIDFELGVKITGAGFPVYKGKGARLQRGLINFFLDEAHKAGYEEYLPPLMVNEASAIGTGQLPDKEAQMYHVGLDNFYLIPTAEVPITNIHRDVIYKSDELPIKNTAYTPCFRREAGSYGKDVRGLNRLHQFDKVEIVQVQHPLNSYTALEQMVDHVKGLMQKLNLPFRILRLCGGDMSFASALTYDFEVYAAAQKKWLEVSSVSNFESFQSNRLKLRFKERDEKPQLAHTLNGSALALPRIVAALLENNQTSEGIIMPEAIRAYTGFDKIS